MDYELCVNIKDNEMDALELPFSVSVTNTIDGSLIDFDLGGDEYLNEVITDSNKV